MVNVFVSNEINKGTYKYRNKSYDKKSNRRIGIGTAQFGLNYGISNQNGQSASDEVCSILKTARKEGVGFLDTAPLYGNSEKVIGDTLQVNHSLNIVTKTPVFKVEIIGTNEVAILERSFSKSLKELSRKSVYALLIHNADELLKPGGRLLLDKIGEFKESGLVKKIGVSVYTKEQIEKILACFSIDVIQLPVNVLDQRLLKNGYLNKIKESGIEIHARSIFLQGLLLMDPEKLPVWFDSIRSRLMSYHNTIAKSGLTPVQAGILFVRKFEEIDVLLFGVENHKQLKEIINGMEKDIDIDFTEFGINDPQILNPSLWQV